jgi:predicted dehydrogenase
VTDPSSRRAFLKTSLSGAAAATLFSPLDIARAANVAGSDELKIALVGCGGRGTGAAANALQTQGPTKLWALADAFETRLESSLKTLSEKFAPQVAVPKERQFVGLDAYRQAIDALGQHGVVLLATPPAFRPLHLEYAVGKDCHVFMEKSFAVDGPGVRRVLQAGETAKQKNLKIAGGLMWRHDPPREAIIRRLHENAIGELITLRTYRMHGAVGLAPKPPGASELAHQIRNYNNFTWLNASFFVDWLIHNLDICCWAKNALPVAVQGMAGRAARTEADQVLDHYSVEYFFADGARLYAQGRHINQCWDIFSDFAHGTNGSAVIMESLAAAKPRIYRNQVQTRENEVWRYSGLEPDSYQVEHDLLFDAIRNDKPYNEAERCAKAVLVAIMGRMAAESGRMITWDEALTSNLELAPGLDQLTWESPPPVVPDKDGRYPIPVPGVTTVL